MKSTLKMRVISAGIAAMLPLSSVTFAEAQEPSANAGAQGVAQEDLKQIGSAQWNADIQKLEDQGRIKEIDRTETPWENTTTYQVNDTQTGDRLGEFTVVEPKKTSERIGGKFDGATPAIVFNQTDQKALKAGGGAAVSAMAAAWAAALAGTVVGSVVSAGVIGFVGGAAAVYLAQNGICSNNRNLVVNIKGHAHCE